jgi:hypothetical protein
MSSISRPIVHGYSILRVTTDELRGDTTPVGVVAWDSERDWFRTRVLAEDEAVRNVPSWARQFLSITANQLERWAKEKSVPYEPGPVHPTTDRFWRAASEILTTSVRLDSPKAMDPMEEPDQDLEALFEAIVQPRQSETRRQERIDGALSRALGELANEIPTRQEVSAFGNAREVIRRGAVTADGVLLIDGVNLAASHARDEADALVSRFMRIVAAYSGRPVSVIVGYTASPGGLNGERHMRDWIRERLTSDVFDLVSEGQQFQAATRAAWERLSSEDQGSLL